MAFVKRLAIAAILLASSTMLVAATDDGTTTDPTKVKIVTSDIDNFYRAFDDAAKSNDPAKVYAYEYLAPGSDGLWGFVPGRITRPSYLAGIVTKYHGYYAAARPQMTHIAAAKPAIVADLIRYKALYPEVVFPNLYFVVGVFNSQGVNVSGVGEVIGAELFSRPEQLDVTMPGFDTARLLTADQIPGTVVHEVTHRNQQDADTNTLLDNALIEGTADFMMDVVDPSAVSQVQWTFGCPHEDALWTLFASQMSSTDEAPTDAWLYSQKAPLDAPPFIGYWIGSRIAQSYYESHGRSHQALYDILHIQDYKKFLVDSGYLKVRPACAPPTA